MDLSNLVMIIVVIFVLTYFMSNNLNSKERSEKSDESNSLESNDELINSNLSGSNISGNNVDYTKESFQTTNSGNETNQPENFLSIESYNDGYFFNVDSVQNTNKYFIELYNPKNEMMGVLHKEASKEPIIATKDATNANQHFDLNKLSDADADKLSVKKDLSLYTVSIMLDSQQFNLHYDGQLSVQPLREGRLNTGHLFIPRNNRKPTGLSQYTTNEAAELDKTFNLDGTMTVNDINNNMYQMMTSINNKVNALYEIDAKNKELSNSSNELVNKPIVISISDNNVKNKVPPVSSFNNTKKSIAEKFQEIDNGEKNKELQKLISNTIVSDNTEIKCPEIDENVYIHKDDINCYACSFD